MNEQVDQQLRKMSYEHLSPHVGLLDPGMLRDPARLDDGANSVLKAYLKQPVTLAELSPELAEHVRLEVKRAIRRFMTDR